MRTALAAIALLALAIGALGAAGPSADAPPIHIYSCKVLSGPTLISSAFEAGLVVRFENGAKQPYKSILWRANYGGGYIDFLDDGTFSPNIRIDNFVLSAIGKAHVNIIGALLEPRGMSIPVESEVHFPEYASLNDPENCRIIATTADDGTKWSDPSVPPEHYLLPAPFPSTEATLAPGETSAQGTVDIAHCHLLFPAIHHAAEADIGYRILAPGKTVDAVTLRVTYGRGTLDFVDAGTFTDASYVRHKLHTELPASLSRRSYFSLDDPKNCAAVSLHFTDGTTWTNPDAPAAVTAPTPPPDALDYWLGTEIVKWQMGLQLAAPSASPEPIPSASS